MNKINKNVVRTCGEDFQIPEHSVTMVKLAKLTTTTPTKCLRKHLEN